MPNGKEFSQAYQAGYECIAFGPNTRNCHYKHFSAPELTREWETGSRDAEMKKLYESDEELTNPRQGK